MNFMVLSPHSGAEPPPHHVEQEHLPLSRIRGRRDIRRRDDAADAVREGERS
jgi:hypothetical protein